MPEECKTILRMVCTTYRNGSPMRLHEPNSKSILGIGRLERQNCGWKEMSLS